MSITYSFVPPYINPCKACLLLSISHISFLTLLSILHIYLLQDCMNIIPTDMICFNTSEPTSYKNYVNELENFIQPYKKRKVKYFIRCDSRDDNNDNVCVIDYNSSYACQNGNWGYDTGNPCLILFYNSSSNNFFRYESKSYQQSLENIGNITLLKNEINKRIKEENFFKTKLLQPYNDYYKPRVVYEFIFPNNDDNNITIINNTNNFDGYLPPIISFRIEFNDNDDEYNNNNNTSIISEYYIEYNYCNKVLNENKVKNKFSFKIINHGCCIK